jgi:transposase
MIRYVGLDVHKRVVEACIVDHAGKVVQRERFALYRSALETFAKCVLRPGDHVALEATTNCWAVADVLRPHVTRVLVSNPMATKAIAQAKVKTDKVDAHVLAQLLRCDFLPEVWQPDEATRRLRELTGRRSALVGQRTMMRNRIHSVLAMRLIAAPVPLFNAEGLEWLATVELDAQARLLVDSDLRQLEFLQKEIGGLDAELARRGHASDPVKLLMMLPGVDVATAEAMLAAWGDAKRFPDGDHAASYLGLVPSTKQSANHCYHGPITKRGSWRHPAKGYRVRHAALSSFARLVRASRGTSPLPLHPLPLLRSRAGEPTEKPPPPVDTDRGKLSHLSADAKGR